MDKLNQKGSLNLPMWGRGWNLAARLKDQNHELTEVATSTSLVERRVS